MTDSVVTIATTRERQALLDHSLAAFRQSARHTDASRRDLVVWLPDSTAELERASDPQRALAGGDEFASRLWAMVRGESNTERLRGELPRGELPRVVLIGSARAYTNEARDRAEMSLANRVRESAATVRLLRVGEVLSAAFGLPRAFASRVPWRSLASPRRQDCFPTAAELAETIATLLSSPSPRFREHALLGQRRSLRDALEEYAKQTAGGGKPPPERFLSRGVGRMASLFRGGATPAGQASASQASASQASVAQASVAQASVPQALAHAPLQPADTRQLLALCHTVNRPHVALAGFNTGVNHFGWRYPGQTLVQTLRTGKRIHLRGDILEADAGVLIKDAVAVLRQAGYEFPVLPNYSYVSLGTVFMVPVHGSGCEVSTLGEAIVKALVYDPATDRIVRLKRGDAHFARWMYNPESGVVVLRLWFRVRPRFRYFRQQRVLEDPSATELWDAFRDPDASHIEARKQRAADRQVKLYRYRLDAEGLGEQAEELPRDTIGRVWDRIEQNRVASALFHAFVRNFGFHVELFLNEAEFALFWEHHRGLPLAKMQFRLARRDGLPHSPCGDCDRMSIDLFMSRRRSARFLAFVKEHLPHARFNRGKHSM
jgi:hypothetical protein